MPLRDYQLQIVSQAKSAMLDHRCIVIVCPTGGGKTVIAVSGLLPILPHPVAWVTHRRELAQQIKAHGTSMDIVMSQSPAPGGGYASIIIDEGHHSCAALYREIISANPDAKIIALTATPYRMDGQGLGSSGFTKIVYGPDIFELTQRGFLCPADVLVPKSESQISWSIDAASVAITATRFNQAVVYCRTVGDAHQLAKKLSVSIPSAAIDGGTHTDKRDSITDKFRRGKIKVICNHTIFTEGYDIPSIDLVVLNRFTQSRCLWRQMTGRGLRVFDGKTKCTILDLAGNSILHGSIYDKEIFNLDGVVQSIEQRTLSDIKTTNENAYQYKEGEELKVWKPSPRPVRILESLARLKFKSPLRRLQTV